MGTSRPGWGRGKAVITPGESEPGREARGPVIHEDVKVAGGGGVQLANAKLWS